jgi:hypothetical protein
MRKTSMDVIIVGLSPNLKTVLPCTITKKCFAVVQVKYKTQHNSCINVR